jgi:hypothetical protein
MLGVSKMYRKQGACSLEGLRLGGDDELFVGVTALIRTESEGHYQPLPLLAPKYLGSH